MGRRLLPSGLLRDSDRFRPFWVLANLSISYSLRRGRFLRVTHSFATLSCEIVRLAWVRHAASVYPEPGSNSPYVFLDLFLNLNFFNGFYYPNSFCSRISLPLFNC